MYRDGAAETWRCQISFAVEIVSTGKFAQIDV